MKIGLIHTSFRVPGGAETTSTLLLEALKLTSHSTTLYTVEPPAIPETKNFRIHSVRRMSLPSLWRYQRMKEVQNMFRDSASEDVLVIGSGNLTLEKTAVRKIIVYCHSTFEAEYEFLQRDFPGLKGIYYRLIQRNIRDSFERLLEPRVRLVANSDYTRKIILEKFRKDSRVIYPPVDTGRFSKWYDRPKEDRVITLSRFSPEKNLKFAVDTIGSGSLEYHLDGSARFESPIKMCEELRNGTDPARIKISSNLPAAEIEALVGSSKVYFHPSKETFGISVVEAVSAGCIPIVPNDYAFVETVPFEELRFNDSREALSKMEMAVAGRFDHLRSQLARHIEKYSVNIFQDAMLKEIESA